MQLSNSDYMYAASQLSSIASSSVRSNSTLNSIRSQISTAIEEMEDNTAAIIEVQRMLGGVLDELKDMHFTIYTQNNITNSLLQSIDETLKTPSQTAAREQFVLATGLMEKHSYDRAKSYLEKAIDLDPLVYAYYTNLSICNYKIGHFKDAAICAKESLLYMEGNVELEAYSRYLLAKALFSLGQVEHAVEELDKASKLSKKAGLYFYYAAIFYTKHKNYKVETFNYFLIKSFTDDPSFIYFSLYEKAFKELRYEVTDMINEYKLMVVEDLESMLSNIQSTPLPAYNFEVREDCKTSPGPERFFWYTIPGVSGYNWCNSRFNRDFPMLLEDNLYLTYENFINVMRDSISKHLLLWRTTTQNILDCLKTKLVKDIIRLDEETLRFMAEHETWLQTTQAYIDRFEKKAENYIQHIYQEHAHYEQILADKKWELDTFIQTNRKPGMFAKKNEKEKYNKKIQSLEYALKDPKSFMYSLEKELPIAHNQLAAVREFKKSFNSQPFPAFK